MVDFNALFKVTYGLYIVCSGDNKHGNGYISNTFFQVTAEPPQFASCCNKNNYTSDLIDKYGHFSVSVLNQDAGSDLFGTFGYRSGRDINKMEGMNVTYGLTGVPIVLNNSVAYLECRLVNKFDVGSHWLFIGELIDAQITDEINEPMTYAYYHKIKKGLAPKNAPTYIDPSKLLSKPAIANPAKYKCSICGHIYDENKKNITFEDLQDNWKCPVCKAEKKYFTKL